jgi:hypothetical protein
VDFDADVLSPEPGFEVSLDEILDEIWTSARESEIWRQLCNAKQSQG